MPNMNKFQTQMTQLNEVKLENWNEFQLNLESAICILANKKKKD